MQELSISEIYSWFHHRCPESFGKSKCSAGRLHHWMKPLNKLGFPFISLLPP
jgi:hypothetical protein